LLTKQYDSLAKICRFGNIMRYEQDRCPRFLPDSKKIILHPFTSLSVQRSKGFIHQHDRWPGGQRPSDCHSLPLSSR